MDNQQENYPELINEAKLFIDVLYRMGSLNINSSFEEKKHSLKDSLVYLTTSTHLKKNTFFKQSVISILNQKKEDPNFTQEDLNFLNLDHFIHLLEQD